MIQQSVGRLAFSMAIREPNFYPVAPPSSKGPGVHPGASASGWERRELNVEARTRTVRGQACRQHTFSPLFHFSELRHMVVPSCKDTGTCSLPGRAQKAEEKHIYRRVLALSVTPYNCPHGCRHDKRNSRKKINRINGCCF